MEQTAQTDFRCKTCHQLLNEELGNAVNGLVECPSCHNVWTVPQKNILPAALQQLRMAEHDMDACDFERAFSAYQKASELDPTEPEAYFGMALANFRVQYLKDEVHNRLQPICHDVSTKKFQEDKNYQRALKNATEGQRAEYKKRAEEIDHILSVFYGYKSKGMDYDCFLCVKVTDDEKGGETADCARARDLYYHLKAEGFSPFFSEHEVKDKVGADYEALILYALYVSRCMIIVCSDESYLRTKWVKNEYTRFITLSENYVKDKDNIAFAFYGAPIEKLPGKKGTLEGIDLSRPDAYSRADKYVRSFTEVSAPRDIDRKEYGKFTGRKEVSRQGVVKRELKAMESKINVSDRSRLQTTAELMKRGAFDNAVKSCDAILASNPAESEAYWLKFLAALHVADEAQFISRDLKITSFDDFEKAIAAEPDASARQKFYDALLKRVQTKKDAAAYSEFIVLPESKEADIARLTDMMYQTAISKKDTGLFNEVIKTITDTDKYIDMNIGFAHTLEGNDKSLATPYYKNVLSVYEGHYESLYKVFAADFGFDGERIFDYCADKNNRAQVEEKLFAFGFNQYAHTQLTDICNRFSEQKTEAACNLFDFLLAMVPKSADSLFMQLVRDMTDRLFRMNRVPLAEKYNELLASANPDDPTVHFNKVLIKNNFHNPLQLMERADYLLDDTDYFNAVNLFAERKPQSRNLYLDIQEALKNLALNIDVAECRNYIYENLYLPKEKLPGCEREVNELLEGRALSFFGKFLEDNGCTEIKELYDLTYDVTQNANLSSAETYARCGRCTYILNNISSIRNDQPTSAKNNKSAKRRKRRKKFANAIKIILPTLYILLALASVFLCVRNELETDKIMIAVAAEIAGFIVIFNKGFTFTHFNKRVHPVVPILLSLAAVAIVAYVYFYGDIFPNLDRLKTMRNKLNSTIPAGEIYYNMYQIMIYIGLGFIAVSFIIRQIRARRRMSVVMMPLALVGACILFLYLINLRMGGVYASYLEYLTNTEDNIATSPPLDVFLSILCSLAGCAYVYVSSLLGKWILDKSYYNYI